MRKPKQIGVLKLPLDVLEILLNLAEDHEIIDISHTEKDRMRRVIGIHIQGPSMPIVEEGSPLICIPNVPQKDMQ